MPARYTTNDKVNNFLGTTGVDFTTQIEEAEGLIDEITGRVFKAPDTATERVFNGNGQNILPVDEFIVPEGESATIKKGEDFYGDSKTTLTEGASLNGYYLMPRNASDKNKPYDAIFVRGGIWTEGFGNHAITAKWAYSETAPEAIVLAATVFAAGIYQYNRGGASGDVQSEKIGHYSVSYGSEAGWRAYNRTMKILTQYTKLHV